MNTLIVTGGSIDYKFACEYLKKYHGITLYVRMQV